MHFIDEGEGEVLLFVHGTPTWSFLYRHLIRALAGNYRCIAVDQIGFGLSEKPEDFDGRPQSHAENLAEFLEKLGLRDITLVVHDFGGPIGLGCALEMPDRIKRIAVFNTWLWETKNNPSVEKIDKIINGYIGKFLYLNLNFSPKVLLKKAFSKPRKLPKDIHRQYIHPFPDKSSRLSLLRLAQSLAGSSDWYQEQWERLDRLAGKPWLFIWGMKDGFITPDFLGRWKSRLPQASVVELDCGHFVQEEMPEASVQALKAFLSATSPSPTSSGA